MKMYLVFLFYLFLAALNIQRGRDHSIASYDDVRQECNLTALPETFVDDLRPPELSQVYWDQYKTLYTSPKDIELFTAGMSEIPVNSGIVGPTFACIIGRQFRRLKYNDRLDLLFTILVLIVF
jgi:peroxidase